MASGGGCGSFLDVPSQTLAGAGDGPGLCLVTRPPCSCVLVSRQMMPLETLGTGSTSSLSSSSAPSSCSTWSWECSQGKRRVDLCAACSQAGGGDGVRRRPCPAWPHGLRSMVVSLSTLSSRQPFPSAAIPTLPRLPPCPVLLPSVPFLDGTMASDSDHRGGGDRSYCCLSPGPMAGFWAAVP